MLRFRDFPLAAGVAIAIYFAAFTGAGFGTLFAPDDFQNIWRCWKPGLGEVIRANLLFVTDFYRPLGAVFYLPLYYLFRFNPVPYRLVYHVLLWLNLWLLYALARRVTGRRAAAALAVVAACFHSEATGVYLSTSMIYEVLCFLFMVGCLVYYIRIRQSGRELSWRELAVFAGLYICALDAKEMAVVIPGMLLAYERAFRPRNRPSLRELAPLALSGVMSVAYTLGKVFGANSLSRIPGYEPVYTLHQFLLTTRIYVGQLLMTSEPGEAAALGFWGILLLLALVMRRRAMWFGLAFAFLAFLPLNFVPPRQGFVLYIPLAGLGIWFGDLVTALIDLAEARLRLEPATAGQIRALAFMACLAAVAVIHAPRARLQTVDIEEAQRAHWTLIQEIERAQPKAKPGGRLLLVNSPLDADWDLYFIAELYLNDRSLKVAWQKTPGSVQTGDFHDEPDNIWRFDGPKLIQDR